MNGRRNRTTKSWIETGVDFRTPAVLSSETDGYEVNTTYFNTGLYTISEASRLTGVSRGRIRRWLRGYHYRSRQKSYTSRPLWRGQWEPIDHTLALGFLDLIEIRFVDAFRRVGVSWATLRGANERAQEMFGGSHPFCTNRFVTERLRKPASNGRLRQFRRSRLIAERRNPYLSLRISLPNAS